MIKLWDYKKTFQHNQYTLSNSMRLVLAITLFILLTTPASAINIDEGVTIPIIAAYSTMEGETGVLLNATVIVTEGNGHVFVDTQPYTQVDLQGSARMATLVASDITGIDPTEHDFYFIIEVTSPIISGPSAGAALTVAAIADIEDWQLIDGVVMTGMINPDGSIGPVGGIPYKLDAAAQHGTSLFIVPEGQVNVVITENTIVRKGAFVAVEEKTIEVDLVERGQELDVEVVEAITIEDAVEHFTGHEIHRSEPPIGVWSAEYLDVLRPLGRNVLDEANQLYLVAMNETTQFSGTLEVQKVLLDRGQEQYDEQQYYAATNTGLLVLNNLKFILWWEEYSNTKDQDEYLNNLYQTVNLEINHSRQEVERFKEEGLKDVDGVGAAEIRVVMAEQLLEDARSTETEIDYVKTLALASMRAETVLWWLSLVNTDHTTDDGMLKDRAGWYVGTASSVVTYARTIISESDSMHGLSGLLDEADVSLDRALIEYERGYYSGAIYDSLLAYVQASTAISLMGYSDVGTKIQRSANAARVSIEESRNAGIEPVLAVSAYEYADSLESPSQQIMEYNYARVLAKTTLQLTTTSNVSHSAVSATPIPLKTVRPTQTPTPQVPAWDGLDVPGFPIISGILGVFAAMILLRR
jgi:uncharacterized protein